MQVICTDGTIFHCESYEVIDGGVKLFSKDVDDDNDPEHRYKPDTEDIQVGYVPDDKLAYILPDDTTSRHTPPAQRQPMGTAPPVEGQPSPPRNPPR